jgi:arabinosyltransferase C
VRRASGSTATFRLIAIVAGLIGFALAVATPLLPVRQHVSRIDWPQPGTSSVTAPLMSYVPLRFEATIPCAALRAGGGNSEVLLATMPTTAADPTFTGLVVKVSGTVFTATLREIPLLATTTDALAGCTAVHVDSTASRTILQVVGGGRLPHAAPVNRDVRPQVVGIFTDVPQRQLGGFHARVTIDSRFSTNPSWLKLAAMIGAAVATLLALFALHRLDETDGRRSRHVLPAHWLRFTLADLVVLGTLVVWHFIGANTSDDGYILTMARVRPHAGYLANYYRWFGVPEAPFGWSYELLGLLVRICDASPWVRLMALVPAVLSWLLISREVLPRLGVAVRHNATARWTAGLVFLAFWLPYNNGLRPEPLIALGALVTWCSIERAVATGRLLPAAVAVLVAAFSLAAGPSGLICVAALLAGSRPILQTVVARARALSAGAPRGAGLLSYLALVAPGLAAGTLVLVVVFVNESLSSVREATKVRTAIGPNVAWFDERIRWDSLLTISPDGSLARRFGVLVMVLLLLVCVMQVLRKGGRIPGTAKGPANRIIGIVFASQFLMMFTPTKWTHHFGVYAGLAASLAALGAVAVSAETMRSPRNRALFAAAILFLLALVFRGTNGWWYVSSYGIPWWDKPPSVHGHGLSTALLALAVLALLVAAWHHYREPYLERRVALTRGHTTWSVTPKTVGSRPDRTRSLPSPLILAAALVVLLELASFAKGAYAQRHSYSIAEQNVDSLTGHTCGLAEKVLVETDTRAGMLTPVGPTPGAFAAQSVGFTPDGVADDLTADSEKQSVGGANSVDTGATSGKTSRTTAPGTGSGKTLPFGLDPKTPVMGSYTTGDKKPASFTSRWYRLDRRGPLLVVTAAGRILSYDASGVANYGQSVRVQYGTVRGNGTVTVGGSVTPMDIGPSPSWRNLRVPLSQIPATANAVRIVAEADDLNAAQWVAVTPPRVPTLRSLQSYLGSETPVLLDWHVGLAFPCLRPFGHRDGVAEIPRYRVLPDRVGADVSNAWQDSIGGGPLGWTGPLLDAQTMPTYLDNDWRRDWGSLERLTERDPQARPATVTVEVRTRSGLAHDPHILVKW